MIDDTFPIVTRIVTQCWEWFHTLWGFKGLGYLLILIVIGFVVGRIILPIINAQIGMISGEFISRHRPERVNRVKKTNDKGSTTTYYNSKRIK